MFIFGDFPLVLDGFVVILGKWGESDQTPPILHGRLGCSVERK